MQTLKTTVVVLLLLVVFYGMYEMLNQPPAEPPAEVAQMDPLAFEPPEIQFGDVSGDTAADSAVPGVPAFAAGDASADPSASAPPSQQPPAVASTSPNSGMRVPASGSPDDKAFVVPGTSPAAGQNTATPPGRPAGAESPSGTTGTGGPTGPPSPDTSSFVPPGQGQNLAAAAAGAATPSQPATGGTPPPMPPTTPPRRGAPQMQSNPYLGQDVVSVPGPATDAQVNAGADAEPTLGKQAYQSVRRRADRLMRDGKFREALVALSAFYKSKDLTTEEQRDLLDLLDPLAARVIYSREHLVEPAYRVRKGETLSEIAARYQVPPELLQKINGIEDPRVLLPGSELKVVQGPFRGDVDLSAQELTMFLDQMYAGRFPIGIGKDPEPIGGEFEVRDKQVNRAYFGASGVTIPAGNPANPFGKVWIDLGKELCIHGTATAAGANAQRGCISLSPRDADDVYSILSVGSRVRILR